MGNENHGNRNIGGVMTTNQKRGVFSIGLGIGIAIVSLLFPMSGQLKEENYIERNEYGEGDMEVSLVASSRKGENEIIYNVSERIYTREEIEEMLPEFIRELEDAVLGENESLEKISGNLNFAEEVEGYPFQVTWSTDQSEYIGSQGDIKVKIQEEIPALLTAEIEYEEYFYEHSFPVILAPGVYADEQQWQIALDEALAKAQADSIEEKYVILPEVVDGEAVSWSKKRTNQGIRIAGLFSLTGVFLFFADRIEKREADKKRRQAMQKEYPEFAMKCAMLIGSGMTLRQAFERIAKSYISTKNRGKVLYEEVLIGVRELQSGVSERQVYESFGRRCGIRETEKFGNLMSRNLRKGSEGLKNALRDEAMEAMEMHKEMVRRQGETSGTKLLFPMMILLLIVMVMIMVPAFGTFNI